MPRYCWAAARGDCEGKISREHIFSGKLWSSQVVHPEGHGRDLFRASSISRADIIAKVLCERHNSLLSPLDAEAVKLQNALRARRIGFEPASTEVHVNGWQLERWGLKCVCGSFSAGWTQPGVPSAQRKSFTTDDEMLSIIFGERRLPDGMGLTVIEAPLGLRGGDHVGWCPMLAKGDPNFVAGILVALTGLVFVVAVCRTDVPASLQHLRNTPGFPQIDWQSVRALYRPRRLNADIEDPRWPGVGRLRIVFEWPEENPRPRAPGVD